MGINRGSLDATFGSKRLLYERALDLYLDRAARDRGEPVAPPGGAQLAAFVVGALQGLRVLGKATADRGRLEAMTATTLDAVVPAWAGDGSA
jgi:hypothetical protein